MQAFSHNDSNLNIWACDRTVKDETSIQHKGKMIIKAWKCKKNVSMSCDLIVSLNLP